MHVRYSSSRCRSAARTPTSSETRMPGRVQQLDHRAIAQAERRRDVGLRDQRVDLLEREELRQRRPGARRPQIVGRAAARAADRARGTGRSRGPRRPCARPSAATARASSAARTNASSAWRSSASSARPGAGRERRQRAQVARVALERVVGQPALDAQMIEVAHRSGDHDAAMTNIRDVVSAVCRRGRLTHACPFEVAVASHRGRSIPPRSPSTSSPPPTSSKAC